MPFNIGDRVTAIENDISSADIAAMTLIRTRIAIDAMKNNNDLKPYLEGFWSQWRDWYQANKPSGTPDLPELDPPPP